MAWLQSPQSSWLTGQILRIDGHKLSRIEGFTEAPARYHAKDGASLAFLGDRPGGQLAVRHVAARPRRTAADGVRYISLGKVSG